MNPQRLTDSPEVVMISSTKHNIFFIIADFRERNSGIPDILSRSGVKVDMIFLKTGDYIINNQIIIERKSADDFIQSLISGRLFTQCSFLKKSALIPLIMLEGDVYRTGHQIDIQAVKGALLSLAASWQIPLICSDNLRESADLLLMLCKQETQREFWVRSYSYKSKRLKKRRLQFLQGLPDTGPVTANKLLEHFGNIKAVINADTTMLREIPGIGKQRAEKIDEFLSGNQ